VFEVKLINAYNMSCDHELDLPRPCKCHQNRPAKHWIEAKRIYPCTGKFKLICILQVLKWVGLLCDHFIVVFIQFLEMAIDNTMVWLEPTSWTLSHCDIRDN